MLSSKTFRSTLMVLASAVCSSVYAVADVPRKVDVPAGDLTDALRALSFGSGAEFVYSVDQVRGVKTGGVHGEYTTEGAVARLLEGTPLKLTVHSSGAMLIAAAAEAPSAVVTGSGNSASSNRKDLEEVVVTAQKREERLLDVPVPVTVLNAENLTRTNHLTLEDYYTTIPGLSLTPNQTTRQPQLAIRGLTTASTYQNTSVAPMIDDIPYGGSTLWGGGGIAPEVDPDDLARVEVLRGPQGTLYGAGSLGGLLKFVTIDPSTDRLSGRLRVGSSTVQQGDQFGYNLRGAANVPVGDEFAFRVSAYTRTEPGYIDNVRSGKDDINENHSKGGRVAGLWRASDAITLKVSALAQRIEVDGYPQMTPSLGDLKIASANGTGVRDTDIRAYSAILNAKVGAAEITSLSGYSVYSSSGIGPAAVSAAGNSTAYTHATHNDKFSQELRLSTPLGDRVDWLFGAFFTKETTQVIEKLQGINPNTGVILPTPPAYLLDPLDSSGDYKEYAVFTNLTFKLTDQFDVQVGARQARYEQEFQQVWKGTLATILGGSNPFVPPHVSPRDNAFTYLVTPRFKISPEVMAYARFASGYRTGGPNSNSGTNALPVMAPDTTKNYELGIKADLLDRRVTVDASVYYIDWKDIQLFTSYIIPGTAQPAAVYTNGDSAKSQGAELALGVTPWRGMKATASAAWNRAELTADMPANLLTEAKSGDRLPASPRFSGNFSLEQEFPVRGNVSGFVGGSVSYVGDILSPFVARGSGLPRVKMPAYAKTDLTAGGRYSTWDVGLYVNNLFDRRGYLFFDPVNNSVQVIQPRTYGLNVTKEF